MISRSLLIAASVRLSRLYTSRRTCSFPLSVDKRALIGQVHPNLCGMQLEILLPSAEHLLDLLDRPVSLGRAMLRRTSAYFAGSCTRMQPWL
jgi:hypothetical protein